MQTEREKSNEMGSKLYRKSGFFSNLTASALADFESLLVPVSPV